MPAPVPVCVFAKPPVAGKVKTRLISEVGPGGAAALAAAMLQDVWSVVCGLRNLRPVLATTEKGSFPIAVRPEDIWRQGAGDLGRRMERVLSRGLTQSHAALALGADSPALDPYAITSAVDLLARHDAVIGPCEDGGFYLLGLRRCPAGLLAGISWSAVQTSAEVRTRLMQQGWSVAEVATTFDVDVPADLIRLERALNDSEQIAPSTRAWLRSRSDFSSYAGSML